MSNVEVAVTALREANPVPDESAFEQFVIETSLFLEATRERSTRMTTQLKPADVDPRPVRPTWRKLAPAIVVAAVVAVVAAAILLATRSGESEVVDDPQSIAERIITGGGAEADELVAADAEVATSNIADRREYVMSRDWLKAIGYENTLQECTQSDVPGGVEVKCTLVHTSAAGEALGEGPYEGSYRVVVVDGVATEVVNTSNLSRYTREVWQPFLGWLRQTHPEDAHRMLYTDTSQGFGASGTHPVMSVESIELWRRHTEEFVAEVGGS